MRKIKLLIIVFFISMSVQAQTNQWAWMSGDTTEIVDHISPVYGTIGVAASANRPGSRYKPATWKDASGNFWLFGGYGQNPMNGYKNDLWKYNPSTNQWTWIKGSQNIDITGVYGTVNVAAAANNPGGRSGCVSWVDASGNFWIFGGSGYGVLLNGELNDLWKYNPTTNQWTWVKGDQTPNVNGVYGVLNTPAAGNKPGGRHNIGGGWTDASGNLWMFGGSGYGSTGSSGKLNDLWRFNPATLQWTWVKGDATTGATGIYGTQGVAAAANKPGSRNSMASWKDLSGNFWLFGGTGQNTTATSDIDLNDLWKYNPTTNQWTWMKGDNADDEFFGVYGTIQVADVANKPGSRIARASWVDPAGDLWMYGYYGHNQSQIGALNDLWKFNIATNRWTWMKGDSGIVQTSPVYGTQGVSSATVQPGTDPYYSSWVDATGNLWMTDHEIWKYSPSNNQWTWIREDFDYYQYYASSYGTQGVSAAANKPGGREGAAAWTDASGNYWLFGGNGVAGTSMGLLNDCWKYNPTTLQWTWMKGSNATGVEGVYGSMGVSNAINNPGSRRDAGYTTDNAGNGWIFGGIGFTAAGLDVLNDLWKFNTSTNEWVWVSGSNSIIQQGEYGVMGVPSPGNIPGSRAGAVMWNDAIGNIWLFGGNGLDGNGFSGNLNDLWKFNTATGEWTWVKGDTTANHPGVNNTMGAPDNLSRPGGRSFTTHWTDLTGNLWLYGGLGDISGSVTLLNDLWKYDKLTNEWTWMKGNILGDDFGVYQNKGFYTALGHPGGRSKPISWTDSNGDLWLMGGQGLAGINSISGKLNDLWRYNIASHQWAWVSGDTTINTYGRYGTINTPSLSNKPGGRFGAVGWTSTINEFWLFGGAGTTHDVNASDINSNDLWKFNLPCQGTISVTPPLQPTCFHPYFNLSASGGSGYQWYLNGSPVPGATASSFNPVVEGSYYAKGVVGACTDIYSNEILLTPPTVQPTLGGNGVYCTSNIVNVGIPFTLRDQTYTWYKNGQLAYGPLSGNGGNQSLQFAMVSSANTGNYLVISRKEGCMSENSNNVYVGYAEIKNLTVLTACTNSLTFTWDRVVDQSVSQIYQYWVSSSPTPPANGTATSSTFHMMPGLNPGTHYYIHVRSACGSTLSGMGNWATISFNTETTSLPVGTAQWTGDFNRDWDYALNWKCGFVPLISSPVIIPGGRQNYPFLISNKTIKSIDMKPGSELDLAPGVILTVTSQ